VQEKRVQEYLQQLTPLARSNLLTELERLELCGAAVPHAAGILATLRAEFRQGGQSHKRVANPSRHFFMPLEPLLVNGAPAHANSGRILRGSLAPIWEWISRELLPTMAHDYVEAMKGSILADDQIQIRRLANGFQIKVFKYLERMLGLPEGAVRIRDSLAVYTTSHAVFDDVVKMVAVLRAREALEQFSASLPRQIDRFEGQHVAKATQLLDDFRKAHPEDVPFALALLAKRLKIDWQLIYLATTASPTKNAPDIAATRYALTVSMVLDRLEDRELELQMALRNGRVAVAKDILAAIHDTDRALTAHIAQLDRSDWGRRLRNVIDAIATVVDQEVGSFPPEVGHVLATHSLRHRDSLLGRLASFARKGQDTLTGAAFWFKWSVQGFLRAPDAR